MAEWQIEHNEQWQEFLQDYCDRLAAQLPPVWELDEPHRFPQDFFGQLCRAAAGSHNRSV